MTLNVLTVTGSRAEFGLLEPLLQEINDDKYFDLSLIVTGTHLSEKHGKTIDEIKASNFKIAKKVKLDLDDDSALNISIAMSKAIKGIAAALNEISPDLVILLGDRFEILAAASASLIACIPVAHIHGGEITTGAFDDAIRHSITKMSHIHFVATKKYKERIIQLGENKNDVHHVGGLGADTINNMSFISKKKLECDLGIIFKNKIILATYHPETLKKNSLIDLENFINALEFFSNNTIIFTMPNADPENEKFREKISVFGENYKNVFIFESLGKEKYLSCMKIADLVIGNSSSGILEAPSFQIPTINIGNRQNGRVRCKSVIDIEANQDKIRQSIEYALTEKFKESIKNIKNPYHFPDTAKKIKNILKKYEYNSILNKSFFDIDA